MLKYKRKNKTLKKSNQGYLRDTSYCVRRYV